GPWCARSRTASAISSSRCASRGSGGAEGRVTRPGTIGPPAASPPLGMADGSRFPQLALPFAIVGASAGWLSTELISNPLVAMLRRGKQSYAVVCAAVIAAATGALLTRWCVGRRYSYEIDAPDPESRADGDTWPRQVGAVIIAGLVTGAVVSFLTDAW